MRQAKGWIVMALLVVGVLTAAPGCVGPEFSRARYDTVYEYQPAESVRRALGVPTTQNGENHWIYVSEVEEHYRADIWFDRGRVVRKSWSY